MKQKNIKHVVKSDELRKPVFSERGDISVATIHAIKGLEAKMVFVVGCNEQNFPCKASDHPVIEMIKIEEYDKEEEEKRLFYVAMSRAINTLYLSYTGKPTNFITNDMDKIIDEAQVELQPKKTYSGDIVTRLKQWRTELSKDCGVPPFMIMHDRTLIDIASKLPLTSAELENVHGMGPTKIMKYGEEILKIVNG